MNANLNKMTVKELREIGKRMDLKSPLYKMKKDEIIKLLSAMIDEWHAEALLIDAQTPDETLVKAENTIKAMAPEYAEEIHKAEQIETFTIPNTNTVITDPACVAVLKAHFKAVKRFNPTLKRDKDGKVILTPKQRRRVHKTDRRIAKRLGLYANA